MRHQTAASSAAPLVKLGSVGNPSKFQCNPFAPYALGSLLFSSPGDG